MSINNRNAVILHAKDCFKPKMNPDPFSESGASLDFFNERFIDGLPSEIQDTAVSVIPMYFHLLAEKLNLYQFINGCIGMPLDQHTAMYVEHHVANSINYYESIIGKNVPQEFIEAVYYLHSERNGLSDANDNKASLLKVRFGADRTCGRGLIDSQE